MYIVMEKKVSAEFVSMVFASAQGSKSLLVVFSGNNHVSRACAFCDHLIDENKLGFWTTLRVVETALNTCCQTASYLRYVGTAKTRKHMNVEYFNI